MKSEVEKKGTRTGFTTGACAAAAAKAATRVLVRNVMLTEIETTLPNRQKVIFQLHRCERQGDTATCSIIKDAGDDPDCTHGAELVAEVSLGRAPGVELKGGDGVATVTKPGLGLALGGPAINPVPRKNITEMVLEELVDSEKTGVTPDFRGATVTIHVPRGEEMAKETLNARLGLIGGISILGTTGIVKPYSTSAYKASVFQAIDVAHVRGCDELVLTTGGKTEQYAMKLFPQRTGKPVIEEAFIQVGDFVGFGLRHAAKVGIARALIVGMMGKMSKMADGKMMTHAAGSQVNTALLARLAAELGADAALLEQIRSANTARHVLELSTAAGCTGIPDLICREVVKHSLAHANAGRTTNHLDVRAWLVDFDGTLLGMYPGNASS